MTQQAAITRMAKGIYTGDDTANLSEAIKMKLGRQSEITVGQIAKWLEDTYISEYDDVSKLTFAFVDDSAREWGAA